MRYVNAWRPFGLIIGALGAGVILGLVVSLFSCRASGILTGPKEEAYLILAATLYTQGETLEAMKVYLNSYAPRDASEAMLRLADKYERSGERKKLQQARDLRLLAESLKFGRDLEPVRQTQATTTPASPEPIITASNVTTSGAQSPAQSKPTTSEPPPTRTPTAPLSGRAVARPASGGAIMREQPSTKAAWVASLQNGTPVEIIRVVEGEAVDPAENRWYLVKANDKTGYVYFKLIAGE